MRRTPIRRSARVRPIRKTPRRSGRVRDKAFLEWLHGLPVCYVVIWQAQRWTEVLAISNPEERAAAFEDLATRRNAWTCWGRMTADHVGVRPLGRKCSDREAIPLCTYHHHCRQTYMGIWRGYDKSRMRAWCDEAIAWTQGMWAQHQDPDKVLGEAQHDDPR